MMRLTAVVALFSDLGEPELQRWIAQGWVRPLPEPSGDYLFAEIDVARTRLLHDLRHRMAIAEDTLPVVLSLLDQVHDLRRALGQVVGAIERQPAPVREELRAVIWTSRPD